MNESVKNPSQNRFSKDEINIINQITVTVATLFHDFIKNHKHLKKMIGPASKMGSGSNKKDLARLGLTLNLRNMSHKEGMFPDQINEDLARILLKSAKDLFLKNKSALSQVLKEFEDKNILFKIEGKKKIKYESPKSIKRKPRVGEAKHQGYPIVHKVTGTMEEYERILSNPNAVNRINKNLSNFGILKKVYTLLSDDVFDMFKKADPKFYHFLSIFSEIFPEIEADAIPDPQLFQNAIKSAGQDDIKHLKEEFIDHLLENPLSSIFFIFSLAGLENYSY